MRVPLLVTCSFVWGRQSQQVDEDTTQKQELSREILRSQITRNSATTVNSAMHVYDYAEEIAQVDKEGRREANRAGLFLGVAKHAATEEIKDIVAATHREEKEAIVGRDAMIVGMKGQMKDAQMEALGKIKVKATDAMEQFKRWKLDVRLLPCEFVMATFRLLQS